MTRDESIEEMCSIRALVYHSKSDYRLPSDGFCWKCQAIQGKTWNFQDAGKVTEYIRLAVLNQLKADGIPISSKFDPETGKEK